MDYFKKRILPHLLAVIGFYFITILVFSPEYFDGKTLHQHDIEQGIASSHQMGEYRKKTGEEPLWNNAMFSGMPGYLTTVVHYGDVFSKIYIITGLSTNGTIFLCAFICFYILLIVFKVRPILAFIGAVAYGLNGFSTIGIMAGHNGKIAAAAFIPLVIAGMHLCFTNKRWLGATITAMGLAFNLRASHPQITYYLIFICLAYGIYALVKAIKNQTLPKFGINATLLILAAVLATATSYGKLKMTLDYGKYSTRGKSELQANVSDKKSSGLDKEYIFRYSNGIFEPLFLLVPNVFGGSSQQPLSTKSAVAKELKSKGYGRQQLDAQLKSMPTYWGEQPLTAPYYAGTLTVFLFILGIIFLPKREKIWLIVLAALGIVLSWGKNFPELNYFLFEHLPAYNKFRSVTFAIIITMFAMNLLGFQALEQLLHSEWNKQTKKKALVALGICGGLVLFLILFSWMFSFKGAIDGQLPDWFASAIRKDRKSLLINDGLRALFFILAPAALIWLSFTKKIMANYALMIIAFLACLDSFMLTKRFLGKDKFEEPKKKVLFRPTAANQLMMQQAKAGERVLNLQNPFNEANTSYFHESVGGYHGAKLRRYQDLIDKHIGNEVQTAIQKLRGGSADFSSLNALNMLNTKFFFAGSQKNAVFTNKYANGNAWTVNEIVPVNSPDEELSLISSTNIKTKAIIDQSKFKIPIVSGTGPVKIESKTPREVMYSATINGGDALVVFSEIYYPEKGRWKAYIDGKETEILRANYILRALKIPSGKHKISFKFDGSNYINGNNIMLSSSILVLLFFFGIAGWEIRKDYLKLGKKQS